MIDQEKCFVKTFQPKVPFIRNVASRYLGDGFAIDDVVQTVLIKIWKNLDRLPSHPDHLKAWIIVTTKNASIDVLRDRQREHRLACRFEWGKTIKRHHIRPDCSYAAESTATYQPMRDPYVTAAVSDFLRTLPKSQGQVLALAAFGMKYEEIAKRTGTSLGTVRSRLHYARKKAQAELAHCR